MHREYTFHHPPEGDAKRQIRRNQIRLSDLQGTPECPFGGFVIGSPFSDSPSGGGTANLRCPWELRGGGPRKVLAPRRRHLRRRLGGRQGPFCFVSFLFIRPLSTCPSPFVRLSFRVGSHVVRLLFRAPLSPLSPLSPCPCGPVAILHAGSRGHGNRQLQEGRVHQDKGQQSHT